MIVSMGIMAVSGFSLAAGFQTFNAVKNLVVKGLKKLGHYINDKVSESWLAYQVSNRTSIWMAIGRIWAAIGYHMNSAQYMNMVTTYIAK